MSEQRKAEPVGAFEILVQIKGGSVRRIAEGAIEASYPRISQSTLPQSLRMIADAIENGHAD